MLTISLNRNGSNATSKEMKPKEYTPLPSPKKTKASNTNKANYDNIMLITIMTVIFKKILV